jgi:hypothetical protein
MKMREGGALRMGMRTKSNRRSFDCAGAKGRACFAQDDSRFIYSAPDDSRFIYRALTDCLYVNTA